jgi:UDP-N-acetylglucosamine 2-epimerase (non-hydrolysing)
MSIGINELIGTNPRGINPIMEKPFYSQWKKGNVPDLWD